MLNEASMIAFWVHAAAGTEERQARGDAAVWASAAWAGACLGGEASAALLA